MKRLLPYPTLAGDVSLEVTGVRIDDVPLPLSMISSGQRVVALHTVEREVWETATLSVHLRTPNREMSVGPWSNIRCLAILAERRTNVRDAVRLNDNGDGTWSGEIVMQHDLHMLRAELSAQIVALVEEVDGRLIGSTPEPWIVDLKTRTLVRHQTVKTVWADFGDETNPGLNPYKDDPWTVEAVGSMPTLYLNRRFEGLESLLKSTKLADRTARHALTAQMAADLWTTLFNIAVHEIQDEAGRAVWPDEWQEAVVRRMLPEIFPDRSLDDALLEIVERRRTGEGGGDLQRRIVHAAVKQAQLPKNLGGFIRAVRRSGREES